MSLNDIQYYRQCQSFDIQLTPVLRGALESVFDQINRRKKIKSEKTSEKMNTKIRTGMISLNMI